LVLALRLFLTAGSTAAPALRVAYFIAKRGRKAAWNAFWLGLPASLRSSPVGPLALELCLKVLRLRAWAGQTAAFFRRHFRVKSANNTGILSHLAAAPAPGAGRALKIGSLKTRCTIARRNPHCVEAPVLAAGAGNLIKAL